MWKGVKPANISDLVSGLQQSIETTSGQPKGEAGAKAPAKRKGA
jgi:non-homologous end joining protein Ku